MNSQAPLVRMLVVLGIVSLAFFAGCGGGASQSSNQPPTITAISPNSALAGGAGFTLTINGTNFVAASVVNFAGTARITMFVSSTQLTAAIPATAVTSAESIAVSVTNPAPGGGTSNVASFTITNSTPTISTISPTTIPAESATFTLTLNGANFVTASVVNFGAMPAPTTFVSATELTASIPAGGVVSAGTVPVTVANPAPGGGTSNAANFTITSAMNPVPAITELDPGCAPVGAGSFTVSVSGSNFVSDSVLQWNGSDLPTVVDSANGLEAQVPGSNLAVAATASVTVFNPAPHGGTSNAVSFPISTGGISPESIAVDPTGKFAYVANQGCVDNFDGNVSMYTIDSTTGVLTSISSPVKGGIGPRSLAVDPSGKFVYLANWGSGDVIDMGMWSFSIDTTSGALTSMGFTDGSCPGLCAPWSVAVHPSGKFVYVADEGGFAPTGVSMFAIDGGGLGSIGTVSSAGRANSVAVDPTGKFVYATDDSNSAPAEGNDVSMFTVNGTTGVLTFTGTIAAGTDPVSVAVDPSGKFVYVANSTSNDVSMYTINTTTGALTSEGTIAAGTNPVSVAVDPTGKFAYVVNSGSNDVSTYSIDGTTSALTLVGTVATESSPTAIAIHPSGKFAYVTNSGSNSVSMYSIDAATGALTLIGTIGT